MKTSHLKLQGLMCSGCSEIIERSVQALAGVSQCKVDFDAKQATVQYDSEQVSLANIQKALAGAGYAAQPIEEIPNLTI